MLWIKYEIFEILKTLLLKVRNWDVAVFRPVTDAPKDVVRSSSSRIA
jgi:hypothetical protein